MTNSLPPSNRREIAGLPTEARVQWAEVYRPEWDDSPAMYVEEGIVVAGKSRRLARIDLPSRHLRLYLGVHVTDDRWRGDVQASFFVSILQNRRTLALRTFATTAEALATATLYLARL